MSKLKVQAFAVSIDGYGAGPDQSLENPLGVGGESLHEWMLTTRTFQQMVGEGDGRTGVDDDFVQRSFLNHGAWILGRNMFGPVRGPWPDDIWKGWWGDNPPFHVPVFVLTHHARESIPMQGGTTFHFVTSGIHEGLERAREAAREACVEAAASPPCASISRRASSTRCTSRSRPRCWATARPCLSASTWPGLGFRCTEHASTPQ